jgi:hypothetical protein
MDIPSPRSLASPENKSYYAIDWYSYSRSGVRRSVFETYHDYAEGWYLILPEEWRRT